MGRKRTIEEDVVVEQRRAKRIDIDIKILMEPLANDSGQEPFYAEVINVSKSGIGFISPFELEEHFFYKARIIFQSKESVDTIIETVRRVDENEEQIRYGGRFVGISESDQFKIEVFRMFAENEEQNGQ